MLSVSTPESPAVARRRHFGTDGVRGVANTELTVELALRLGMAAAVVLGRERSHGVANAGKSGREIVVGRDTRRSCDLLEAALVAGLCAQGANVTLLGVLPTPGVAFVTKGRGALAGVVLSASHNPFADNGIKFFGSDGRKLSDEIEAQIEAQMETVAEISRPDGANVGAVTVSPHLADAYADHLVETATADLAGLRLVLDCANGAASFVAPALFSSLGVTVETLFATPDGLNINDDCGSLHPQRLLRRVAETNADAGLAFDGDADRVILCDGAGRVFDGDKMLCALGTHLARQGKLAGNVVVGTIMSNMGLEVALRREGIGLVRAAVGDRYVHEAMKTHGATLGGEKSGHILLPHLSTTGDGILTALQILCLCRESGSTLADWNDKMPEFPQKLVSVKVRERDGWDKIPEITDAIAEADAQLAGRGRLNVRPSGTEKLIRVMVEGPDAGEVEAVANRVVAAVRAAIGA